MFLVGLLCWNAVLAIQGCGGGNGGGGGGYGGKSEKGEVNANPPAPPGPCECIGGDQYKDSKKMFKKFPEDTGKWCNQWDKEYHRRCQDTSEDHDDWNMDWCEKLYCLVPKDCELDDTEIQYDGNFEEEHGMDSMWSSKNCDSSLWSSEESTSSPAEESTSSP
jgi:hypothetical protein